MHRTMPLAAAALLGVLGTAGAQTVTTSPLPAPSDSMLAPAPTTATIKKEETVVGPSGDTRTTRTTTTTTTVAPAPLPPSVRHSNTAAPQSPMADPSIAALTTGDLIGREVYDTDGQEIGEIAGVAFNTFSRTISAIVELDTGVLGIGDRQVAVDLLELRRHDDRIFLSSLTKEQLKTRPEFAENAEWDRYDRGDVVGMPPAR